MTRNFMTIFCILLGINCLYGQNKKFQESYDIPTGKVLYVDIEIDAAEFNLRKSSRLGEATVTIYYDEEEFDVYVNFNEKRSRLDIEFDKRGWFGNNHGDFDAEVIIELPADVEVDLKAKIKAGEIDIDFGGMALTGLDLTTWAGEVNVEFSEPNKSEIEFLKINTKIGETEIVRLGNARFHAAEINGGIGEMRIDFKGSLLSDATAEVDLDIGETRVSLPNDIGIKLRISKFLFLSEFNVPRGFHKSGKYYYSKNYDDAKNTFDLRISPGLGELKIN